MLSVANMRLHLIFKHQESVKKTLRQEDCSLQVVALCTCHTSGCATVRHKNNVHGLYNDLPGSHARSDNNHNTDHVSIYLPDHTVCAS